MNTLKNTPQAVKEITPLNQDDLFILLDHPNADFDYPFHFHTEYEINMVSGVKGQRIVGDTVTEIDGFDLVLLAPYIPHSWKSDRLSSNHVITIQFHEQFLDYPIIQKRAFNQIRQLLANAKRGISFYGADGELIAKKINALCNSVGFKAITDFLTLLQLMSNASEQQFIASNAFDTDFVIRNSKSRRISLICEYVNNNYMNPIKVSEIAAIVNMSESALSHFFKNRTNRSLISYINEARIGQASKLLLETTYSINEICFLCGFNNISNFNRTFKANKGCSPSKYREDIQRIITKY